MNETTLRAPVPPVEVAAGEAAPVATTEALPVEGLHGDFAAGERTDTPTRKRSARRRFTATSRPTRGPTPRPRKRSARRRFTETSPPASGRTP